MLVFQRVLKKGSKLNSFADVSPRVATRKYTLKYRPTIPSESIGDGDFDYMVFGSPPKPNRGPLPPASSVEVKRGERVGMTLVSIENESNPISTLSVFVKAGSRYEHANKLGCSHFLKRLAFSNTFKKYHYPLLLDNDVIGNDYGSLNAREYVGYFVHGLHKYSRMAAQTLAAVVEPQLEEYQVLEARRQIENESEQVSSNPKNFLIDAIHSLAFRDQSLAHSEFAQTSNANLIDNFVLREYVNTHYLPDRMILVGDGYKMSELEEIEKQFVPTDFKQIVSTMVSDQFPLSSFHILAPPEEIQNTPNRYVGGSELRIPGNGDTHMILASSGVGATDGIKACACSNIAQFILGGGAANQNSIMPGMNFGSSLGSHVLSNPWIQEARTFNYNYSDAGLFGIYFRSRAGHVPELVEIFQQQYQLLKNLTDQQVQVAKNQYKTHFAELMYSCPISAAEYYTFSVDNFGFAHTPQSYLQFIDSLSKQDIVDTVIPIITSSKISVAAIGDVKNLPMSFN